MSRKRLPVWRTLLVMATDIVAIGAGIAVAYQLRFHSYLTQLIPVNNDYISQHYIKILPFAWVIWFLALRFENLYRRRSRVFDFNVVRRIITGSCLALLILIALNFYIRMGEYSRTATSIMLVSVVAALILNRLVLHCILQWLMLKSGVGQARTVIVGGGPVAHKVFNSLLRHPERGLIPIGLILGRPIVASGKWLGAQNNSPLAADHSPLNIPVLGTVEELEELLVVGLQAGDPAAFGIVE